VWPTSTVAREVVELCWLVGGSEVNITGTLSTYVENSDYIITPLSFFTTPRGLCTHSWHLVILQTYMKQLNVRKLQCTKDFALLCTSRLLVRKYMCKELSVSTNYFKEVLLTEFQSRHNRTGTVQLHDLCRFQSLVRLLDRPVCWMCQRWGSHHPGS